MGIIIFNLPGMVMILIAFAIGGGVGHGFGGSGEGPATALVGGMLCIPMDLFYRYRRGRSQWVSPRAGGHIWFIPVWILGVLMLAVGLFAAVQGPGKMRTDAYPISPVYVPPPPLEPDTRMGSSVPAPVAPPSRKPAGVKSRTPQIPASPPMRSDATANVLTQRNETENLRDLVARNYSAWIGDDATLLKNMRWLPIAKRPTMGVRWGIGIYPYSAATPKPAGSSDDFATLNGTVASEIVRQLQEQLNNHSSGAWSDPSNRSFAKAPVFLGRSGDDLLDQAGIANLDGLVMINLTGQRLERGRTLRVNMVVQLADVLGHKITWSSSPLNEQKPLTTQGTPQNASAQLVREVMTKLGEQYGPVAMPAIAEAAARHRAARLAESVGIPAQVLRKLAELRYYQAKNLLSQDDAEQAYRAIVGDKAKVLASGDGPQRAAAVEEWFQSQR